MTPSEVLMTDENPWSNLKATLYSMFNRNPKSNLQIGEILDLTADATTLDVGCGPGAAVRAVAPQVRRAVGVDASPHMVEIARRRSIEHDNVEFFEGAVEALPFPDATFTHAWAIKSWHHWNDSPRGLAELVRVLRPGGSLYVVERETNGAHGLSRVAAGDLERLMSEAGLAGVSIVKRGKDLVVVGTAGSG